MEHRVTALERAVEKIDAKLDRLIESVGKLSNDVAYIKGRLDGLEGRVAALPTTIQMITLVFGILGGAFLILKFGLPHAP